MTVSYTHLDVYKRQVFLIARFCAADCCNRRAGQIFVVIPALERISRIGHIVGLSLIHI